MDVRRAIFRDLLANFVPGHLLDLACGHGKFSVLAAEEGWSVTAVDVRTERMRDEPSITWVQADVRDYAIREEPDVIAVLGLLYHLTLDDQLTLLRRTAHRPTIVDTHVSLRPDREEMGFEGHLFQEATAAPTASWGNEWSFWPTEASLVRMFYDAGYASAYKHLPSYEPDRTFWLCLPPAAKGPDVHERWRGRVVQGLSSAATQSRAQMLYGDRTSARARADAYEAAFSLVSGSPARRALRSAWIHRSGRWWLSRKCLRLEQNGRYQTNHDAEPETLPGCRHLRTTSTRCL